ncbi:hypothetical protein [Streptococcus sp. sy018]|uniref:hypothetical protein n=1 Tax=Streptococcus sp. sy018 TaxID=2600147 RepID=UPI0011B45B1C|nr:hypothetical protein [Streptococcus sp. sy018]TWS94562.1 hypothetical protein FRX52_03590 [Streptococcus sp. sy018]
MIEELNLTSMQQILLLLALLVLWVKLIRFQPAQEDEDSELGDHLEEIPTDNLKARYGAIRRIRIHY